MSASVAKIADKPRCTWAAHELAIRYHDQEWGRPVHDERVFFEFLILEGAQAGLSWDTILKKRDNYRRAFDRFDPIVRNRLKIEATISNARAFLELQREFGSFDKYVWRFVGGKPLINKWDALKQLPASTPESDALSKDLRKRGFRFVGTTIIYAFMQATGLVNDHLTTCYLYPKRKLRSTA